MDNNQPYTDEPAGPVRSGGQSNEGYEGHSGTQAYGERNDRDDKRTNTEQSPLLGADAGSSSGLTRSGTADTEWAGYADFEGLTWWHKPSVSQKSVRRRSENIC